jgi:hypothetical protein
MKTLVIHPTDPTTDFLSVIYQDEDWTVVRNIVSTSSLIKSIQEHDSIIMMGHGSESGLYDINKRQYIVDDRFIFVLREKQCTFIWCHADEFVRKYKLKGLYSGMVISDYEEALYHSVNVQGNEIEESNTLFAEAVRQALKHLDPVYKFKILYEGESNVIAYNRERFYYE